MESGARWTGNELAIDGQGKGNSPLAMATPLTMAAVMDPLDDGSRRWIPTRDVRGWRRARPGDGGVRWMGKDNSRLTMAAGDESWTDERRLIGRRCVRQGGRSRTDDQVDGGRGIEDLSSCTRDGALIVEVQFCF
jgi:hypothetical protein